MESIASQGTSFRSMSWTGGSTTGPTFQSILLCNDSGTASCCVSTTPCPLGMPCLHQLYSLYNPDTLSLFSLTQDKLGVASPLVLLLSMIWGLQILQVVLPIHPKQHSAFPSYRLSMEVCVHPYHILYLNLSALSLDFPALVPDFHIL